MATKEVKKQIREKEEAKWMMHYSSNHQILLVGDGNFSFSLCLALAFGSASNISATSLDSYAIQESRIEFGHSKEARASIYHGVDAKKMKLHPDLRMHKFDRIIFNFPHAGFYGKEDNPHLIGMHRSLVKDFFRNASVMLRADGEVHVSHKTTAPFCNWHIEELASESSLSLIGSHEFKIEDYPGYNNKRGHRLKCDEPFPLGECRTFIFGFFPANKRKSKGVSFKGFLRTRSQRPQEIPGPVQKQEIPFDLRYPHIESTVGMNEFSACAKFSRTLNIQRDWPKTYDDCFNNKRENFGRAVTGVGYFVDESRWLNTFGHAQTDFSRTRNDLPEHLELPLPSDTQRENARIYNSPFNSVNEIFRRANNDMSYPVRESFNLSERYMLEASGIPRNARNCNGCFNNVNETLKSVDYLDRDSFIPLQRYMAEAPGLQRENVRIYGGCFNNVNETIRRVSTDVGYPVCESLISFEDYVAEAPERTSNGYMYLRDELCRQRALRWALMHRTGFGFYSSALRENK